jgi:hypothetical protein
MTVEKYNYEASHNGKEISFFVTHNSKKYRVIVSQELLNDELGNDADFDQRKQYIENNIEKIRKAFVANIEGAGFASKPFASGVSVRPV